MNFDDTESEASFRAEAQAWLQANAKRRSTAMIDLFGDEARSIEDYVAAAKVWQAKKYDAGFAAITWPKAYGGRDGAPIEQVIFEQEESQYESYSGIFGIGLGICCPAIRAFGAPAQRERFLRAALRGEEMWCQLFSEPSAGSDLAGIRTRAERHGDDWIVNGQKVWTTGAHYSDWGILLARTDSSALKHNGLTMFLMDMKLPGVSVRPVRQISGRSDFNEVFMNDVRLTDTYRLGEVGDGWKIAIAALMFERYSVGELSFIDYDFIMRLAGEASIDGVPAIEDGRVRERIADMYINSRALKLLGYRAQTALSKGHTPGPEQAITKVIMASQAQRTSYLAMDLQGETGMLTASEHGESWRGVDWAWAWGAAMRIAGGTDEILRNIIAERVLGMPNDVRVDKDVPYNAIP